MYARIICPVSLQNNTLSFAAAAKTTSNASLLVIDSRESVFGYNPLNTYDELAPGLECPYEIMFLECEDSVLVAPIQRNAPPPAPE